ncbi:MAG: hypothetical protein PVSMB7_27200 [Chloroflexota bacterium]
MMDVTGIEHDCRRLQSSLAGTLAWPEINRIHHELAPIIGQLQAAVGAAERAHGDTACVRGARAALDRVKATQRQVGLDIRLSSPAALTLGLSQAVEYALEVLGYL